MARTPFNTTTSQLGCQLMLWCLLIALPVYGLSSTLTQFFGASHTHRTPAVAEALADPMTGWQDFRRIVAVSPSATVTPHPHGRWERHHHEADDASVISVDSFGDTDALPVSADGQPAGSAALALAFDAISRDLAPATRDAWLLATEPTLKSRPADGLDRPPKL